MQQDQNAHPSGRSRFRKEMHKRYAGSWDFTGKGPCEPSGAVDLQPFNINELDVEISNPKFEDDITPKGIHKKIIFDCSITNRNSVGLRFLCIELVSTFTDAHGGSAKPTKVPGMFFPQRAYNYRLYRSSFIAEEEHLKTQRYKGEGIKIHLSQEQNQSDFVGVRLYRFYGETMAGEKFQQELPEDKKIDFDGSGRAKIQALAKTVRANPQYVPG